MTNNTDNGNKHFDKWDVVSAPLRIVQEADATWRNFGVYARGTAFYDYIYDNNELDKFGDNGAFDYGRLLPGAKDRAAYGAEMQDYFVRGEFDIGTQPLNVRVGNQVVNWGEALFTQNAISIINPLDLQKLVTPGSELRDGLIPVPMAWASYEIVEGLALEGFYQWGFEEVRLPPTGSFFSGADVIGGEVDSIGGVTTDFECGSTNSTTPCLRQLASKNPGNDGNYGVKLNWFSPELNNTEFGFYYVHYTSRFPSLSYVVTDGRRRRTSSTSTAIRGTRASRPRARTSRTPIRAAEYVKDVQMFAHVVQHDARRPRHRGERRVSFKKDVPGGHLRLHPVRPGVLPGRLGALCGNQCPGNYFRLRRRGLGRRDPGLSPAQRGQHQRPLHEDPVPGGPDRRGDGRREPDHRVGDLVQLHHQPAGCRRAQPVAAGDERLRHRQRRSASTAPATSSRRTRCRRRPTCCCSCPTRVRSTRRST